MIPVLYYHKNNKKDIIWQIQTRFSIKKSFSNSFIDRKKKKIMIFELNYNLSKTILVSIIDICIALYIPLTLSRIPLSLGIRDFKVKWGY